MSEVECPYCGADHNPNDSKCRKIDMRGHNFKLHKSLEDSLVREGVLKKENAELREQRNKYLNMLIQAAHANPKMTTFSELQEKIINELNEMT